MWDDDDVRIIFCDGGGGGQWTMISDSDFRLICYELQGGVSGRGLARSCSSCQRQSTSNNDAQINKAGFQ